MAQAPLDRLTARTAQQIRVRSAQPGRARGVLCGRAASMATGDGDELTVAGASQHAVAQLAFDHGIVVYEIAAEASSLEDVFFSLTNGTAESPLR